MKTKYIKPTVEMTEIQLEDILTISNGTDGDGTKTVFDFGDITWNTIE